MMRPKQGAVTNAIKRLLQRSGPLHFGRMFSWRMQRAANGSIQNMTTLLERHVP